MVFLGVLPNSRMFVIRRRKGWNILLYYCSIWINSVGGLLFDLIFGDRDITVWLLKTRRGIHNPARARFHIHYSLIGGWTQQAHAGGWEKKCGCLSEGLWCPERWEKECRNPCYLEFWESGRERGRAFWSLASSAR